MKNLMKKLTMFMMAVLIAVSASSCAKNEDKNMTDNKAEEVKAEAFPKFTASDFDGNKVDDSMFKDKTLTVLNFWFNGCSACVEEIADLEKFNEKLKEKGAELVGVNVEANYSKETLEEAKNILAKKGGTYRNIMLDESEEVNAYLKNIMAFPTTVLVDSNGNIVAAPIAGNINDEETFAKILKAVDEAAEKESK